MSTLIRRIKGGKKMIVAMYKNQNQADSLSNNDSSMDSFGQTALTNKSLARAGREKEGSD